MRFVCSKAVSDSAEEDLGGCVVSWVGDVCDVGRRVQVDTTHRAWLTSPAWPGPSRGGSEPKLYLGYILTTSQIHHLSSFL